MLKERKKDWHSDLNKKLNIALINMCTEAEGPYRRMAIWFQGCNVLCDGCCNPELQPIKVAHIMTVQEIIDVALDAKEKNGIEGITFLGGEPTLQENLYVLCAALREHELGTILFTGKSFIELPENLINNVDMVVDGKFDENQIDFERNLVGSMNQRIHLITERYKAESYWFWKTREKKIEINISCDSSFLVTGDVI